MLGQKQDTSSSSIIGIVLIFAILIGYSLYTQPTQEQIEATRATRDSLAQIEYEGQARTEQQQVSDSESPASVTEYTEATVLLYSGWN